MTRNEALFEYRRNKGLSLEEASSILGIKKKKLKSYEEGYRYLKDETAKDFAKRYGLEESAFLLDDKGYITSIDYEDKTKLGLLEKATTIIAKTWVKWTSLALALISMAVFLVGILNYASFYVVKGTFFEEPYSSIYYAIKNNGESVKPSVWAELYGGSEAKGIEYGDDFFVSVPAEERYAGGLSFSMAIKGETGITDGHYYLETYAIGASYMVYIDNEVTQDYIYTAMVKSDGSLDYLGVPEELIISMNKVYELEKERANDFLLSRGYSGTINELFAYLEPQNLYLTTVRMNYVVVLGVGGLLMAAFFLVLTLHFAFAGKTPEAIIEKRLERYTKKKMAMEAPPDLTLARDIPPSPHYFPFVLKEDWLRCIFLMLFFIGNLAGIFTSLAAKNPGVFGPGTFLGGFGEALPYLANLASFTLFFLKIEGIIRHRDTLLSFFSSLSLALLFYVGEVYFYLYIGSIGTLGEAIANLYLPGNMFSGLAAITLFAFFMLRDPDSLTRKWQIVIFRLFALIPFTYLLLGFSVKAFGRSTSIFVSGILNSRIIEICMFAVAYVIFLFISKTIAEKRYGKDKAQVYLSGNRFLLYKNIFLVSAVIAICILSYFIAADNTLFTIEYDKFLYLLIPVFLFYRPRYPVSPMKNEFLFETCYVVALGAPYVLAAIVGR